MFGPLGFGVGVRFEEVGVTRTGGGNVGVGVGWTPGIQVVMPGVGVGRPGGGGAQPLNASSLEP
jgi:hypothetical protein